MKMKLQSLSLWLTPLLLMGGQSLAQAQLRPQSLEALQRQLDRAVCQNEWDQAVPLINQLITAPSLAANYRTQLVDYRRQLEQWAATDAVLSNILGCDLVLAQTPVPDEVPRSPALDTIQAQRNNFDWDAEITALQRRLDPVSVPLPTVGVTPASAPNAALFAGAIPIAIAQGQGQGSGAVSNGHQFFSFFATAGDVVSVTVMVTDVLPGNTFTDDDSQLFLFDAQGQMIAENDDHNGLQSALVNQTLPTTGQYFVAVTTFDNDPILNGSGVVTDWPDTGSSSIRYNLQVTGVSTPIAAP